MEKRSHTRRLGRNTVRSGPVRAPKGARRRLSGRSHNLRRKGLRIVRRGRRGSSQSHKKGYDGSYQAGYNAGFAKGFEDGHQLKYSEHTG
ncbi:hypothetical protein M5W83_25640 [Paenibacillus thiaminolyticus]|uniref:General stress protein n=1 Tax=Paenibacillus thiaminolyticus TaxID=49283 RepID=A0ABT4G3A6_PANTH|nr:hypothetical protein [Paenibacillus thiaminolyticus]MCY9537240.1 hypothetical protein [Paenibacillus thiaminolyticus]MCY9600079.1 hypothetical protein [Paenibacillus thiaminolyticus]MCY9610538.1 hypothetical protein [Paenibacillus thiaminolyticus]MCY9615910.1 hypothetical protein [Paenibacillus thiaminolyticus]MCY9617131.1 hypothetical protein [Paenibacillus thiaminolyticus]